MFNSLQKSKTTIITRDALGRHRRVFTTDTPVNEVTVEYFGVLLALPGADQFSYHPSRQRIYLDFQPEANVDAAADRIKPTLLALNIKVEEQKPISRQLIQLIQRLNHGASTCRSKFFGDKET
ncbi:MAG TPA: hypothetical protein PLC15_08430 [Candidatus Obscuribacter sp.]|nr:hypothetical protein [Candidatus Obscuribacter sp.]MBK9280466.1 hypothetical protein [Candidatus Obscuribacter sp.]MBL8082661.1 hypothetical protein [Candidatus Obscuribacter sp.]HNB15392.1 hypothetical protein [Candidatus Obscuribacter sp.]HNG18440.1 hypothetical protein [Candidatus Obscuribacter sp.]